MTRQEIIDRAVSWAIAIANDDTHGYNYYNWGPDYDCLTFVVSAYDYAGVPHLKSYIANNRRDWYNAFTSNGFIDVFNQVDLSTFAGLEVGDLIAGVYNPDRTTGHIEIYIGNGMTVSANNNENGGISGGHTGDQTGLEISIVDFSRDTPSSFVCTNVFRYSVEDSPVVSSHPIYYGSIVIPQIYFGRIPILRVYHGTDLVFETGDSPEPTPTPDEGTGTISYTWDESTRKIAVARTSTSGNASYSLNNDELTIQNGTEPSGVAT